jgi:hypothetical protein
MYSSTLPSTSALDGVGGQHHAPAALPLEKTQYALYRRLDGPQGWSGRVPKISSPRGFDPRTVQSVASCYTDWAITAVVCISIHLQPILRYKFVIFDTNHPETLYLRKQGCEDTWLFLEVKRGPRGKRFWKIWSSHHDLLLIAKTLPSKGKR